MNKATVKRILEKHNVPVQVWFDFEAEFNKDIDNGKKMAERIKKTLDKIQNQDIIW